MCCLAHQGTATLAGQTAWQKATVDVLRPTACHMAPGCYNMTLTPYTTSSQTLQSAVIPCISYEKIHPPSMSASTSKPSASSTSASPAYLQHTSTQGPQRYVGTELVPARMGTVSSSSRHLRCLIPCQAASLRLHIFSIRDLTLLVQHMRCT